MRHPAKLISERAWVRAYVYVQLLARRLKVTSAHSPSSKSFSPVMIIIVEMTARVLRGARRIPSDRRRHPCVIARQVVVSMCVREEFGFAKKRKQ